MNTSHVENIDKSHILNVFLAIYMKKTTQLVIKYIFIRFATEYLTVFINRDTKILTFKEYKNHVALR